MTIPSWPATLPKTPLREGFQKTQPDNRLVSSGDSGFKKIRPKGAPVPWSFNVSMFIGKNVLADFETFINRTLHQGALRFSFEDPITEVNAEMRVASGESLYTITPVGFEWKVSFKVEVLP